MWLKTISKTSFIAIFIKIMKQCINVLIPLAIFFFFFFFTQQLKLKTHKFESAEDISLDNLKLCPIIDQTVTYIYKISKAIAKYLSP